MRRISDKKIIDGPIVDTSGSITWSYDDKYFFYTKLDKFHRAKKIYRHKLGSPVNQDELIFEEKDDLTIIDTGMNTRENRKSWTDIIRKYFRTKKISRVIGKDTKSAVRSGFIGGMLD